jgi:glutamate racemase
MRIGIFDSGIGGLTVLKEFILKFPQNEYFYLGDTANVPYGTKSTEQIKSLSSQAISYFKNQNLDLLVVACNTASSLALNEIKSVTYPTPVIGVVEPGVKSVLEALQRKQMDPYLRILILGTKATIRSGVYGVELRKRISFNTISEQSCPLIVPLIEENWIQTQVMDDVLSEYVKPYKHDAKPGIALLACTHYPWALEAFERALPGWTIVNSASSIAKHVVSLYPQIQNSKAPFKIHIKWTDPKSVSEFVVNEFKGSFGIDLVLS